MRRQADARLVAQRLCVLLIGVSAACGGGGGDDGGGSPAAPLVSIAGSVAPPSSVTSAPSIQSAALTPPSNLLLPPNASPTSFPAIAQSAQYTLVASGSTVMISSVSWDGLDVSAYVEPLISVDGWPQDPTIGEPEAINVLTVSGVGLGSGSNVSIDSIGVQPAVLFESIVPGSVMGDEFAAYVLPNSAGLNPAGYTYQTYGAWNAIPTAATVIDGYFSTGIPTTQAIAVIGLGTYSGQADATFVDATTGDFFDVATTVNVQVDFVARTLTFSTTGTTSLSNNAPLDASPSANPALDLNGVLSYPVATNTFTGTVTTANGMSGNVTGRFYGPVLSTATGNKAIGSPTELGGTFAVSFPTIGTLQGSFGAQ